MIQLEKPQLSRTMPVVWPTLLDLGRDECKRILRKLELEAYAGVISALRAQGDLTKDKKELLGELNKILGISTERHRAEVRRAVNDERLTTIAYHMSGPNSSSEWSIEGRRLVPLMPRLVPQTAFTVTANAVANATANQNASLMPPAETGNKEVVVCYSYTSTTSTATSATASCVSMGAMVKSPRPASPASNVVMLPSGSTVYVKSVSCSDEDEKPRKRRRTNSSGSSPVVLKEVTKVTPPMSKTITLPVGGSPKMSNIMQSIANSLPPHMSPVKITFTKPSTQTTNTTTQKVIIVTTSPSSNFVPNILSKSHSHNYAAMSKLVSTSMLSAGTQKQQAVVFPSGSVPPTVAVTAVVSATPSVVMSTIAQCGSSAGVKVTSTRLPSPKTLVGSPTQILAQFPKQLQQGSPMGASSGGQAQASTTPPGSKPTIQIKQESGVKIITQQIQPSKILPKPSSAALPSGSSAPIMVVSSNGAIMTTKLVSQSTGTQATYSRPMVSPAIGARMTTSPGGATYVKTTSGSIITVVPKSLATLGGKIISSNMVSGTTTKITTIPMTSKPNVIVVQKTTGKGTTIQGLPGKNVVTTLLNAGGEKALQSVQGAKPAIITASRPITKMIVTQPKGMSSGGAQPTTTTTKIIPTKIVYGQQGKTQVLIKPKPMFQTTAVLSEQTRQLVSETLQQASLSSEPSQTPGQEGLAKDETGGPLEGSSPSEEASHTAAQDPQAVVHVISSREQDWLEQQQQEVVESSPTIIYQEVSAGDSQSAASTIKALLELQQQATVKDKGEPKPRQHTIDLSQMVVPITMVQEKKPAPESTGPSSSSSSEPVAEHVTAGKLSQLASSSGPPVGGEEVVVVSSAQQLGGPFKSGSQAPLVVKSVPTSSGSPSTHLVQMTSESHGKADASLEEGELEGDTLDPQTGLFYRSRPPPQPHPAAPQHTASSSRPPPQAQPEQSHPAPPQQHTASSSRPPSQPEQSHPAPPQQHTASSSRPPPQPEQSQHVSHSSQPSAPQLQLHSKPLPSQTLSSSSSSLSSSSSPLAAKKLPPPIQEQSKLQTFGQSPPQERPSSATGPPGVKAAPASVSGKPLLTPQLPKLQQAPRSHHRPLHSHLSQPPPLQAHHPVSSDKASTSSQLAVQQPIITQGATVTKITFGGGGGAPLHSPPPVFSGEATAKVPPPESSSGPAKVGAKPSASDILKISMMEAEIDYPGTEPMVVDSSSDCSPLGKALATPSSGPVDSAQLISSSGASVHRSHTTEPQRDPFGHILSRTGQKSKGDLDVIEVIPQYSIMPDSSQSNVVVEPSGFLEITNYTSQQLQEEEEEEEEEEESAMEQEVDSSNDETHTVSPMIEDQ
ncbi:LOW QUALITY PROTEIN: BRCA2-interacting transcriptional repressor EMSY [Aplochiton taeniatus]